MCHLRVVHQNIERSSCSVPNLISTGSNGWKVRHVKLKRLDSKFRETTHVLQIPSGSEHAISCKQEWKVDVRIVTNFDPNVKEMSGILAFIPVCSGNMVPDAAFGASNERNVTGPTGITRGRVPCYEDGGLRNHSGWFAWIVDACLGGESYSRRRGNPQQVKDSASLLLK